MVLPPVRSNPATPPVRSHTPSPPVRSPPPPSANSRRSRTPPAPAQVPKRGPKRAAAAELKVNPDRLYVKTNKRHRYTNRYKAQVLSLWMAPTPRVGRSGGVQHRSLKQVAEHTKVPFSTLKKWSLKANREKIFSEHAGLRCVQRGKAKWPRLERRLYGEFLAMREKARPVRLRWFRVNSKKFFHECYPTDRIGEPDFLFSTGMLRIHAAEFQQLIFSRLVFKFP
jgi:hypothetical protein